MFSKKYLLIMIGFAIGGAAVIQIADWAGGFLAADGPWRIALVLLPIVALIALALKLEWHQFQAWDELQQRVHLEAMTLASAAMVVFVCCVTIIEFMSGEQLAPMLSVVAVHGTTYFVALGILRRRYQ